jgi:cytochrome P450
MTAAEDISSTRDHFADFDMDSPEFNEQYDQVLDDMLERCPVAHSTVGRGYYVVNRQADVRRVAQDWKTFSSRDGMYPNRPAGMPPVLPEEVDPPYHKNWRVALNKHFSAKRVAGYADSIREQVTALIDGFVERGSCDFVAEFAALLPGRVFFATLLKAPLDDLAALVSVVDDAIMGTPEQRGPAWTELHRYIDGYLEQRHDQPPRDDFVDAILAGVPDETGEPCSWDDKVNVATLFLSGAVGTTASAIAGVALHLATHPQDREYLAAHPEAHGPAVEELIRIHSPVVALSRTATTEVEVAGTTFAPGDRVLVNFASACRDPRVFPDPMCFDLGRDQAKSAAFGLGPHRCIGAHLALLELTITLEEMLRRLPDLALEPGAEVTYSTGLLRLVDALPVRFISGVRS